jgi:hypothetical protein
MFLRVIPLPLSGGDRKSLAKQLRFARQAYDTEMKRAAEARGSSLRAHWYKVIPGVPLAEHLQKQG